MMSATTSDFQVILLVGLPASTKSKHSRGLKETNPDSILVSRDIQGGTMTTQVDLLEKHLQSILLSSQQIILDNLNLSKGTRKPFIETAKKYGAKIIAHYLETSLEDCQIRHLTRMYKKHNTIFQNGKPLTAEQKKDPHIFPPAVLFKARKELEPPTKDEGFDEVITIKVVRPRLNPRVYDGKALFLDIDGTIRQTEHLPNKYPTKPEEVKLLHSKELMRTQLEKYREQGYQLIGVSNQSGIAKGTISEKDAKACFEKTRELLGYSEDEFPIIYCPHTAAPISCFCRKPQSGMALSQILERKLYPGKCLMVGDRTTDETMAKRLSIPYIDVNQFWKQYVD
jgi:histidinol-phosphate phosphatase family protein